MSGAGTRLVVLVNPSARRSGGRGWLKAVRTLEARGQVAVQSPASAEGMAAAARNAVRQGATGVVVVGGDGSVNHVANELAASDVALGVVPVGTGNDFARAMGIPSRPELAARQILGGHTRRVDLVRAGARRFCTAGLLGVPSDAAMTVRRWLAPGARTRPLLHLLGAASYSLAGARHLLLRGKTVERYVIDLRGEQPGAAGRLAPIDVRAHGVFFANTAILGGGLVLPLQSDAADGLMEVAVIPEMPRPRLIWAFLCLNRGWRVPAWALRTWRARAAEATCEGQRRFSADGDLIAEAGRFPIVVEPLALRVFCGDAAGGSGPQ